MRLPGSRLAQPRSPAPLRHATWPWAAGSMLVVVLVIGGALAGHRIVGSLRQNAAVVAAPALAPLDTVAVTDPNTRLGLVALDAAAGHLVALSSGDRWPQCPPTAACPAAPAYDSLEVLDGASGQPLSRTALDDAGGGADARLLLADSSQHIAYAVGDQAVRAFSTLTGAPAAGYAMPDGSSWAGTRGGALDASDGALLLTDGSQLVALDARSGRELAHQSLPPGARVTDGPVVDAEQAHVYVLLRTETASTLVAYDARTLAPAGQWPLLAGARLGPLDDTAHALYLFLPGGITSRLAASIAPGGATTLTSSVATSLHGATAVGWNASAGHVYAADSAGLIVRDSASGQALSSLPIQVALPPDAAMPVDAAHDLVYLPTAAGELVIAHDESARQPLSAATALLLGRSAMARFLPDTNQDPAFVTPQSFPAGVGTRAQAYWIHFSDLGWQGPYPGSVTSTVARESGAPGPYIVSYTIAWNQLFARSHTWTCEVRPDGSVRLQSQSGDAVP